MGSEGRRKEREREESSVNRHGGAVKRFKIARRQKRGSTVREERLRIRTEKEEKGEGGKWYCETLVSNTVLNATSPLGELIYIRDI